MKSYGVTIKVTFGIEAGSEEQAKERAAEVYDAISDAVYTPPERYAGFSHWLDDIELSDPDVQEE